jgi:hypothetical protein
MVEALVRLPPSRRQEMIAALETVVAAMGVADQAASMFFEEEGESASSRNGVAHSHNGNGVAHSHNGNGLAHSHNGNGLAHSHNGNGAAHASEVDRGAPAP